MSTISSDTSDSFTQSIAAAGWYRAGSGDNDNVKSKPNALEVEVKQLQEALAKLNEESKAAAQEFQHPQHLYSSSSSLVNTSTSSSSNRLSSLSSEDQVSQERTPISTPLLSPLFSHHSFISTPPTSIGGHQTPESSSSLSSQLGQFLGSAKEQTASLKPPKVEVPTTKKTKNVHFSAVEFLTEDM